jgi:membrane protein YdbS with pleckstrin-like domain
LPAARLPPCDFNLRPASKKAGRQTRIANAIRTALLLCIAVKLQSCRHYRLAWNLSNFRYVLNVINSVNSVATEH